jgi:hypothetical protein
MGDSLHRYLKMKVHQTILSRPWESIIVTGRHSRTGESITFDGEKRDKPFNWQRPTARVEENSLFIQCFPGADHIRHYADLITTYLTITDSAKALTPPSHVRCLIPTKEDTRLALESTNLSQLPQVDIAVLGLVHRLGDLTGPFSDHATEHNEVDAFGWTIKRINDRSIAFIGFRPSFWGDISGEVVGLLARKHGIQQALYIGKLGSLKRGVKPNRWLATGEESLVQGKHVRWRNAFQASSLTRAKSVPVKVGRHVTLPSVLHETREWLATVSQYDFVDPEVGMMAQAAVKAGISFGYLHIVSDNVAEKYSEDLSNERDGNVLIGRDALYQQVQAVLRHHFQT